MDKVEKQQIVDYKKNQVHPGSFKIGVFHGILHVLNPTTNQFWIFRFRRTRFIPSTPTMPEYPSEEVIDIAKHGKNPTFSASTGWERLATIERGRILPLDFRLPAQNGGSDKWLLIARMLDNMFMPEFHNGPYIVRAFVNCRLCGRALTNPESVSDGIGPECSKKTSIGKLRKSQPELDNF